MRRHEPRHPIHRLRPAIGAALLAAAAPACAVNWLMIQGTEPPKSPTVRPFGFVWVDYQRTEGSELPSGNPFAGQDALFNTIGPKFEDSSALRLHRLRLGVRGALGEGKVNYYLNTLAGDNLVTRLAEGPPARLTDASLTFNQLPGAHVRVGMFKTPGAEEGLQLIPPRHYINFTGMTAQLLQEQYFDSDGSAPLDANDPEYPAAGFRDIGAMVFDAFAAGGWEHSYAAMIGNGHGIQLDDDNGAKDLYLYWSSERVFGGKGPHREGLKLFAWSQQGKRTLRVGTAQTEDEFDRTRRGLGLTYLRGPVRAGFEYVQADGMIYNATDGAAPPGVLNNAGTAVASFNVLPEDEARGWYADLGYRLRPGWWLDLRYDRLDRGTDTPVEERRFDTWTLGTHYQLDDKTRLMANYEWRSAKAPNLPAASVPNRTLDVMDDRLSLQLVYTFF